MTTSGEEPTYAGTHLIQQMHETGFNPWIRKIPWSRKWLPTHPSILAWKIPWAKEPGGLQSMRPQSVGHDRVTKHRRSKKGINNSDKAMEVEGVGYFKYMVYLFLGRFWA